MHVFKVGDKIILNNAKYCAFEGDTKGCIKNKVYTITGTVMDDEYKYLLRFIDSAGDEIQLHESRVTLVGT